MPPTAVQAPNAWRVLFLLFLANLFNFFDRTIPAIVTEPVRREWNLSDLQIGLFGTAFTLIYALAGVPLGRLADSASRARIMGWGLTLWSGLTALNGLAWNFWSFLLMRMGVGIGEASYAPAANSLIGDLFPAERRARAMGLFMLGLPLGLTLAFFTVGLMVEVFGSWRAPFFLAAVPGLLLALFIFFIREPARGAAEGRALSAQPIERPLHRLLSIPTFGWLILAGLAFNFAAYACNLFMVPLLMRYFALGLNQAALSTGLIVGISGLIGLTAGGWLADRSHQRRPRGRLLFGALSLALATLFTGAPLLAGRIEAAWFVGLFSVGWLCSYCFYTTAYPAIQDVVEPRLRGTAMALFFAALYLLGGGLGPVVVGLLSDRFAETARLAAGAPDMQEAFKAAGLHDALYVIPVALLLTTVFLFQASRCFVADARRMQEGLREESEGEAGLVADRP